MDPDNPDIYSELGAVLSWLGKIEEAERLFTTAQQKKPGTAKWYAGLGRTLFRQGKPEQAQKAYRKAVEMAPGSADADTHHELGFLLARQGRLRRPSAILPHFVAFVWRYHRPLHLFVSPDALRREWIRSGLDAPGL